jgi:branched-chain amino acid transport system substrate-binding protein
MVRCGAAAGGLVAAALVTVPVASDVVPETDVTAEDMPADDGSVVSGYAGERWFLGLIPAAGTVGFRGFMNLYALLLEAGGDDATSDTLARLARASVDRRSFWGHPYTCDGNQVPGLPALCAPQQLLFELATTGDGFSAVTGWIPTDELFARALG